MILPVTIALAGLMGASGVMLAAAGAHAASGVGLDSAAHFLVLHAAAVIALAGAIERGLLARMAGLLAIAALILGTALFSGDIAMRGLLQTPLFRMAAPSGGFLMIGGWLLVTVAGAARLVRR